MPEQYYDKIANAISEVGGEVRLSESALLQPLKWKRGRRIFWNAHGDLFHENVPDEWIDRLFAVCALTPQHTHMILTKRSARMREYVTDFVRGDRSVVSAGKDLADPGKIAEALSRAGRSTRWATPCGPLPNVWLGVSVEDQARADERIPDLLATPAAVRFLSCEPLLGPVDLTRIEFGCEWLDALAGYSGLKDSESDLNDIGNDGLDWVIVGGESGQNARPMHPEWALSLRDQCATAGVAFHFKQWGEWLPCDWDNGSDGLGTICWPDDGSERNMAEIKGQRPICSIDHQSMWRVGKKAAGRLLTGRTHDEFPA